MAQKRPVAWETLALKRPTERFPSERKVGGRGEPGNPAEMGKSSHSGFRPSHPPKKKTTRWKSGKPGWGKWIYMSIYVYPGATLFGILLGLITYRSSQTNISKTRIILQVFNLSHDDLKAKTYQQRTFQGPDDPDVCPTHFQQVLLRCLPNEPTWLICWGPPLSLLSLEIYVLFSWSVYRWETVCPKNSTSWIVLVPIPPHHSLKLQASKQRIMI